MTPSTSPPPGNKHYIHEVTAVWENVCNASHIGDVLLLSLASQNVLTTILFVPHNEGAGI